MKNSILSRRYIPLLYNIFKYKLNSSLFIFHSPLLIPMRKTLYLLISLIALSLQVYAQEEIASQSQPTAAQIKIGYFSYEEALCAMPEYSIAQANLKALRSQFDQEMQNGEKEFSEKYETFIEEQHNMASVIREKRQSELQSMMERNVAFRQEAARLMAQAEKDAMTPLREKLSATIKSIAEERAYIMVVNTDSNACPYLSPTMAEDISTLIIDALK